MKQQRVCFCTFAALAMLTLTSCGRSPVRELQKKVTSAPRAMVLGTWVGRFEFDDPKVMETMERSINGADREMRQQLLEMSRQIRWYRFYEDGNVDFYDVRRRRPFRGKWEIAYVEGRTVGVNIRTSAKFNVVRPVTFLAEDTFIIRPRLNGASHARFGRIVFRRAEEQPAQVVEPTV